jgi:hypothetical protein
LAPHTAEASLQNEQSNCAGDNQKFYNAVAHNEKINTVQDSQAGWAVAGFDGRGLSTGAGWRRDRRSLFPLAACVKSPALAGAGFIF